MKLDQKLQSSLPLRSVDSEVGESSAKVPHISPVMERPTAGSLGINQSLQEMISTGGEPSNNEVWLFFRLYFILLQLAIIPQDSPEESWDLDCEGISDSEIDAMLLKPAEVAR